jgi:DNA-binding response OmpR family regulator
VKLIILEDDPFILACTEDALAEAGFEVLPTTTSEEAIEALAAHPDAAGMMVDVRLGGALDGWAVARIVRETHPNMAIVYTTTALGSEYQDGGVDRSVLLQKPYPLERAVSCVREAISKVTQ